jgi:hypothetical protein
MAFRIAQDGREAIPPNRDQPVMTRLQIVLIDWPIRMGGHRLRVKSHGSPEVRDKPIDVVNRLDRPDLRPGQEHGGRAGKRLDVVLHVSAKSIPNERTDLGFRPEPRKGRA